MSDKGQLVAVVDCSFGTCRNAATHRASVTIAGGRLGGESVTLWVCREHSKQAPPEVRSAGLLRRIRAGA